MVWLKSRDPVSALVDFARSHRVSDVIVGRSSHFSWQCLLRRSALDRLVDESEGLDLHIVAFDERDEGRA